MRSISPTAKNREMSVGCGEMGVLVRIDLQRCARTGEVSTSTVERAEMRR